MMLAAVAGLGFWRAAVQLPIAVAGGLSHTHLATKLVLNPDLLPPRAVARTALCCQATLAPLLGAGVVRLLHVEPLAVEYGWLALQALLPVLGFAIIGVLLGRTPVVSVILALLALGGTQLHDAGLSEHLDFIGRAPGLAILALGLMTVIIGTFLAGHNVAAFATAAVCFSLHPIFGGLAALCLGLTQLCELSSVWRQRLALRPGALLLARSAAGPALFIAVATGLVILWRVEGRLSNVGTPANFDAASWWSLMYLRRSSHLFPLTLPVWHRLWAGALAAAMTTIALATMLHRELGPGALERRSWLRIIALVAWASVITVSSAVASDLLRQERIAGLTLYRVFDVVYLLLEITLALFIWRIVAAGLF